MADHDKPEMMLDWLDENSPRFTKMADDIWAHPEILWGEFFSSKLQADFLKGEGFKITENPAGMNTAFIAEWGEGKPILGLMGEYDALPGLSQVAGPDHMPISEGAPGHGCGHNLLGVTTLAATVALQKWMQQNNIKATLRYYGCPAEEIGGGKVFFARDGYYDDLDAALSYHPGIYNMASYMSTVAVVSSVFKFKGISSHAGSAPHLGRSALDAVELMNVGANYMREHVLDGTRIHYVITNGGQAANIVPEAAAVHYIIRAEEADYAQEVMEWLRNIARGAALMTGTTYEEQYESGFASMYANRYLADLMYGIMEKMDPIEFTAEELAFAQKINDAFGKSNVQYLEDKIENVKMSKKDADLLRQEADQPLLSKNYPPMDGNIVFKGATDVGDLSQVTPTAALWTACFPTCTPGHSWANTATSGMSIGHKGMLHGAKIIALTAAEMLLNQEHFDKARAEFNEMMEGRKYQPLLPEGFQPPHREL